MTKQAVCASNGAKPLARRQVRFITATALATGLLAGLASPAAAADDIWIAPADTNGDWDDGANWNTNTPPVNPADTAVFNTGHLVTLTSGKIIDGIRYDASADAGTIDIPAQSYLWVSGAGIVNNSF